MKLSILKKSVRLLCAFLFGLSVLFGVARGQEVSKVVSARNLHRWVTTPAYELTFQRTVDSESIAQTRAGIQDEIQIEMLDIPVRAFISGLAISGDIQLNGKRSMIRVILIDNQSNEYLVYEAFPLITRGSMPNGGKSHISHACQESCVIDDLLPVSLRVELVSASLHLSTIDFIASGLREQSPAVVASRREKIRSAQERELIDTLNLQLMMGGFKWVAGTTPISRLRYAEKKKLFGDRGIPNLQGIEYYKGGVFELPARIGVALPFSSATTSSFVPSFDWRARHGANNSNSPYYDGDPTGSGWITPVKMQLCADCWAHAANGAVEAGVNLYFNKHLDLDLSEQQLVSCGGAGGCSGGSPPAALFYIMNVGVVDEACFPETGRDDPCANMCASPEQTILIGGYEDINPWDGADNIKEQLIKHGPLNFGIVSWWHAIVLVGYDTDLTTSEPIWILKNSWGEGWGENGYFKMKVDLSDIYLTDDLLPPFISRLKSYEIACRDEDHDGFYNWGSSTEKPASCGNVPATNDCNDWDPAVALQQSDGSCVAACKGLQIESLIASPDVLWPPNHKMSTITVLPTTKDDCDLSPVCKIESVNSTEQPGNEPDWSINDDLTVSLRATRSAKENGRVYSIKVTCTDKPGNRVSAHVNVTVPHDLGN